MSAIATETVWSSSKAQRGALLVMLSLAREANDAGTAILTLEKLSELTRLSTRAITNCLGELSKLGELTHRRGVGRGNPNRYTIRLGGLASQDDHGNSTVQPEAAAETAVSKTGREFSESPSKRSKSATENENSLPGNEEVSSSRAQVVNTPVGSINNHSSKPASSTASGESRKQRPTDPATVPEGAREVVDAMTNAGMLVGWRLTSDEWDRVTALSARWGSQQLIEFVARRWDQGRPPQSARYLLRIWDDLPSHDTSAAHPGNVVPLRRAAGGWKPYRNSTPASAYQNGF